MAPGLGAVYRAPLGVTPDSSLFLYGSTGGGKSEVGALLEQHYGSGMDRQNLPGNWSSTVNALERQMFLCKDALLMFDDFKPGGGRADIDSLNAKADRIFRGAGNHSARDRCWADGSLRVNRPPRCMGLATGEDRPRGESCAARRLDICIRAGSNGRDIILSTLTPYQEQAAAGIYSLAMSCFLLWIARHGLERVRDELAKTYRELRLQAASNGHPRTPGVLADLGCGWKFFLQFALEVGAITEQEREDCWSKVWAGILEAGERQQEEVALLNPSTRFLSLLSAAVASGKAHVASVDGNAPAQNPKGLGWIQKTTGAGMNERTDWVSCGSCVGWTEEGNLYLNITAAFGCAQSMATAANLEAIGLSEVQLIKRMDEDELILSKYSGKNTITKLICGRRRSVIHIALAHLGEYMPEKAGAPGARGAKTTPHGENDGFSAPSGTESRCARTQDSGCAPGTEEVHVNGTPKPDDPYVCSAPGAPGAPGNPGIDGPWNQIEEAKKRYGREGLL
jgi:hypothetical protein